MPKPRLVLPLIISSFLLFQSILANAQTLQTATLTILPGPISFGQLPDDFNFDTSFIPSIPQTIKIYKLLSPSILNNTLRVDDADPGGGFDVTISMSDFESTTVENERIHYTNLALVSLTQSLTETADGPITNIPPGAPNTLAPLHCDWNPSNYPDMNSYCDSLMNQFTEPAANTTLLANNIQGNDTTIDVNDASQLESATPSTPKYIIIEDDVIRYTGIISNQLTGVSLISISHSSGKTVTQYHITSNQVTLLSNPSFTDVGEYSIGFGFKLNYDEATIPDNYTATLTFTLIPLP